AEARDGETESRSACIAHEGADGAVEAQRQVERQERRNDRRENDDQRKHFGSETDYGKRDEREESEAAREPVEAINHIEPVDQRDDEQHGKGRRERAQRQIEEERLPQMLNGHAGAECDEERRAALRDQPSLRRKVETIVDRPYGDHKKNRH